MANEIVTRAGIAGIGYQLFCSNNVIVGLSLGSICFREQILVPSRIPHFSLKSEPRCSLWSPKTLISDLLDLLKLNQVTEIGAFMVRTKLASEFEFPAPILQGRTAGTENKFKNFCLFTTL